MSDTTLEIISQVTEFNDLSEFMQDKDLDKALEFVIKLVMKPDVPSAKAPELIIQLQALSAKFSVLARYYTTFEKGGEASKKKNAYYTMSDCLDRLVDALKYSAKFGV
jgi:hypothetical protein